MQEIVSKKAQDFATRAATRYNTAIKRASNSAWGIVQVVAETTQHSLFQEAFGGAEEYAKTIGISRATLSKYIKCWDYRALVMGDGAGPDLTVGQVQELLKIPAEEVRDFVKSHGYDEHTACLTIRKDAKAYLAGLITEEPTQEPEESEESEETVQEYEEPEETTRGFVIAEIERATEHLKQLRFNDDAFQELEPSELTAINEIINFLLKIESRMSR